MTKSSFSAAADGLCLATSAVSRMLLMICVNIIRIIITSAIILSIVVLIGKVGFHRVVSFDADPADIQNFIKIINRSVCDSDTE